MPPTCFSTHCLHAEKWFVGMCLSVHTLIHVHVGAHTCAFGHVGVCMLVDMEVSGWLVSPRNLSFTGIINVNHHSLLSHVGSANRMKVLMLTQEALSWLSSLCSAIEQLFF